ncbi:PF13754 domain-containing protein [Ruminococcus gauvreauii]|uniref:PF13754 domain-containing protein n=1 Tax=Ruminococcus gauvreauii TaxID=438033 RepID=UPI00398408A7
MVKQVYGESNGRPILFSRTEGDRWETTVPFVENGEYVVELYAEDIAGNTAYLCSMLWAISGHELVSYIVPRGFDGSAEDLQHGAQVDLQEYLADVLETKFGLCDTKTGYESQIEERGYTVECEICR